MANRESDEWLQWICSTSNADELRQKYDQWASTYEDDIENVWHTVPSSAASLMARHVVDKQGLILDVGVGTGLVGMALTALGFRDLVGFDISPGMLEKAAEKGVYRTLVCCSIGDEHFDALEKATGAIATGVFAETHAGPAELEILQTKILPSGVLVFTARQSFLSKLQNVIARLDWSLLEQVFLPIYDDPMYLLAYRIPD